MEAPLVSLDEEFEDLRPCYIADREEKAHYFYGSSAQHLEDPSLSELENFSSEIISFKSMEDLVNEFDEKLNICFRNYNAKTENLAPVKNHFQIQEEEENLQDEDCYLNYLSVPAAWLQSHLRTRWEIKMIHEKEEEELNEKSENDSGINEEPLLTADQISHPQPKAVQVCWQQLALFKVDVTIMASPDGAKDSFIHSGAMKQEKAVLDYKPLQPTVIEEIEEMMQNSPDPEEEEEILEKDDGGDTSSQADSVLLQEIQALSQSLNNNWSCEASLYNCHCRFSLGCTISDCSKGIQIVLPERVANAYTHVFTNIGLGHMSVQELLEILDRVEGAIQDYSEELVQQLACRDELEFEKEVKNSFITILMEVQNKQKEHREMIKRRRKEKGLSLQNNRIERAAQMPLKRFSMEGISNILQTGIRQTFGNSAAEKQYLNTVIPYEKKGAPPSVEDLQMLTNNHDANIRYTEMRSVSGLDEKFLNKMQRASRLSEYWTLHLSYH
ncbi:hypothetical protein Chor_002368 [Crotalus horridus]